MQTIELKEFNQPFDETGILESDFVASGKIASLIRYGLVPSSYHWRARAVDSRGAISDWQEFGTPGNIDFEVKLVPLYTQVRSPYPSDIQTAQWSIMKYGTGNYPDCWDSILGFSSIRSCGCAITSIVILGRYYDIDTAINGSNVDPGNINTWLTRNEGYTSDGGLWWGKAIEYLGFIDDITRKKMARLNLDYYNEPSTSYRINDYVNSAKPIVAYSSTHGHYFVIDGKIRKDGIDTYTLKDPAWYNTKTLNDAKNLANKVQGYGNYFSKVNLFSYLEPPKKITASMYLYLASPGELLVTDPQGRKLGKDPINNIVYNEIPEASYTLEGTIITSEGSLEEIHEAKVVYISTPIDGTYIQ